MEGSILKSDKKKYINTSGHITHLYIVLSMIGLLIMLCIIVRENPDTITYGIFASIILLSYGFVYLILQSMSVDLVEV